MKGVGGGGCRHLLGKGHPLSGSLLLDGALAENILPDVVDAHFAAKSSEDAVLHLIDAPL